jgi:trk system potassium uptake protein
MRVVILGCGRIGSSLAIELDRQGHTVGIVDLRHEAFQRFLPSNFRGRLVLGHGIDEDVLRRAGLEQADCFVALTNEDNTNVMAAQVAGLIFHVPKIICRIYDREREETFRQLGLRTFAPIEMAAARIKELVEAGARRQPREQPDDEAGG